MPLARYDATESHRAVSHDSRASPLMEWDQLNEAIIRCRRCPRLVAYCAEVARRKRAAYRNQPYWGKPVPNFGDPKATVLIVGLAPGAHGANRTGRMFTGDRSGQWLFAALNRHGFANRPDATHRDDGLKLTNCAITAACHCAPPANKPTAAELAACAEWFRCTFDLVPARIFIALGRVAWDACVREARRRGWLGGSVKFAHGAEVQMRGHRVLLGSYHPSQQNTFTGRLTVQMFDAVFRRAAELASRRPQPGPKQA